MTIGEIPTVLSDGSVPSAPGLIISEQGIEGIDHSYVARHDTFVTDIDAYWTHPELLGAVEAHQFLEGPDASDDVVLPVAEQSLGSITERDAQAVAEMQAWLGGQDGPYMFGQL